MNAVLRTRVTWVARALFGCLLLSPMAGGGEPAHAQEPRVGWVIVKVNGCSSEAALVVAKPIATNQNLVRRQPCRPGSDVLLLLEPGGWTLGVAGGGLWSQQVPLVVKAGDRRTIELTVVPGAQIHGEITADPGVRTPAALNVSVLPADVRAKPQRERPIDCALDDGRFECSVPAGRASLRLRAPGFVSLYFWDVALAPGSRRDVGRQKLVAGASVTGFVDFEEPTGDPLAAELELAPDRGSAAREGDVRRRLSFTALKTTANPHGFFHFQGVTPGTYRLVARARGFAESEMVVRVLEAMEVRTETIRMGRPVHFVAVVTPAVQPSGEAWRVELLKEEGRSFRDALGGRGVTASGVIRREGVAPGHYRLIVRSKGDEVAADQTVELVRDGAPFSIELETISVEGVVIRGSQPVSCIVRLRRRGSLQLAEFRADEEGKFSGHLPAEGLWRAELEVEPQLYVTLLDEVDVRRSREATQLTLELPDTHLRGRVIDGRTGSPPADAVVLLSPQSSVLQATQLRVSETGEFEVRGLPEDAIIARAQRPGAFSKWMRVELQEGQIEDIELRLEEELVVRGLVQGPYGPIAAARILAFPDAQAFGTFKQALPWATSAPDGSFELRMPPGTLDADFLVDAPGHALKMTRPSIDRDRQLVLTMVTDGGTIVAAPPARREGQAIAQSPGDVPMVHHQGAAFPMTMLASRGGLLSAGPGFGREAPFIEPGEYTLCRQGSGPGKSADPAPGGRGSKCASGFVFPYTTLELALPE